MAGEVVTVVLSINEPKYKATSPVIAQLRDINILGKPRLDLAGRRN